MDPAPSHRRLPGASSGLEIELAALEITFKHGRLHPVQTQGKVERCHRTLKAWLRGRPPARTFDALEAQIDRFVTLYNEERPHQARGCPPMQAWRSLDKATPVRDGHPLSPASKVRHDKVGANGTVTLRYRSKLHHLGIGRGHKDRRVLMLVCGLDVRVITEDGELLRHLELDPTKDCEPLSRATV